MAAADAATFIIFYTADAAAPTAAALVAPSQNE